MTTTKDNIPKTTILIFGTRTYTDSKYFNKTLEHHIYNTLGGVDNVQIVSGGAKGADYLAKVFALKHNIDYKEFPAEWDKYGNAAGPIRNRQMFEYIAERPFDNRICIAFWDGVSRGTKNSIELAKEYGVTCFCYRYDLGIWETLSVNRCTEGE